MSKPVRLIYVILNLTVLVMLVLEVFNGAWYNVFLCALTLALFTLPFIIGRRMKIRVPTALEIIALLFIFAAEILGEMRDYYAAFPYWDKMLHTTNGFLCAAIGLALVSILNDSPDIRLQMSPIFVVFFSSCFSMSVGVLWEFLEYFCDLIIHTNMQKDTILANGAIDIGLNDTMGDLIVNFIGASLFSVFGYFYIKSGGKGRIIPHLLLTREPIANEPESAIESCGIINSGGRIGNGEEAAAPISPIQSAETRIGAESES